MPNVTTPALPVQTHVAANTKDYAIIIGVKDYMELTPLDGPLSDTFRFAEWLLAADGGDVPIANCYFIPSDNTTNPYKPLQDDVDTNLDLIFNQRPDKKYGRLYFYFSGHGYGTKWDINGLCLPRWSNRFRRAALSSKSYLDLIVESDLFEEVFMFFDCCRDRKINALPAEPILGWAKPGGGNTMALALYAAEFENPAFEGPSVNDGNMLVTGYFTDALLDGLKGGAANRNGEITVESLVNFVKKGTEAHAKCRNQEQSADFLFKGSPTKPFNPVIFRRAVKTTELNLRFMADGDYELRDPGLETIQKGHAVAGTLWVHQLKKGVFTIVDIITAREEYIVINSSAQAQTKNYDF